MNCWCYRNSVLYQQCTYDTYLTLKIRIKIISNKNFRRELWKFLLAQPIEVQMKIKLKGATISKWISNKVGKEGNCDIPGDGYRMSPVSIVRGPSVPRLKRRAHLMNILPANSSYLHLLLSPSHSFFYTCADVYFQCNLYFPLFFFFQKGLRVIL